MVRAKCWSLHEPCGLHGGWHDFESFPFPRADGECFRCRRLQDTARRIRTEDRRNTLSSSRSPMAAAKLCLAELRSLPEFSRAERLSRLLAGKAGGAVGL